MSDRETIGREDQSDYLWDGAGPADPAVARLEAVLSRYRHRGNAPALPEVCVAPLVLRRAPVVRNQDSVRWRQRMAVAAIIGLAVIAGRLCPRTPARWHVEPLDGAPTLASSRLTGPVQLREGQWLQTDAGSRARIDIAGLGDVRVDPGTRVRVMPGPASQRWLDLSRGSIHAFVMAPPRMFQVNTPGARAVDMGCEYTLRVDEAGAGELRVLLGYVRLEWGGRSVTIPMDGGVCLTRPGYGPGTPFFSDASTRMIDEVRRLDFESGGEAALNAVLSEARARDALTLWHLLASVEPDQRGAVYDRLSQLKPPPAGVIRAGVLALDRAMLDAWWDEMRPF